MKNRMLQFVLLVGVVASAAIFLIGLMLIVGDINYLAISRWWVELPLWKQGVVSMIAGVYGVMIFSKLLFDKENDK